MDITMMEKGKIYKNVPSEITEELKRISTLDILDSYSSVWDSFSYHTEVGNFVSYPNRGEGTSSLVKK